MVVAFTGHRDYEAKRMNDTLYRRLAEIVAAESEITFLSGMAIGFDLAAAEMVLSLKDCYKHVELKCIVPFEDQSKYFSGEDRLRYDRVVEQADEVVVLEREYSKLVYMHRNAFLVDNADMIIAYFNVNKKGGTADTMRRARKAQVIIENLYPQQQLSLF